MNIKPSKASKQAKRKVLSLVEGSGRPGDSLSGDSDDEDSHPGMQSKKAKVELLNTSTPFSDLNDEDPRKTKCSNDERSPLIIPVPPPRNNDHSAFRSLSHHDKKPDEYVKKLPLLMANVPPQLIGMQSNDTKKFKLDMSLRPSEVSATSKMYESVPVEKFGAAMLRGMGWVEPNEEISSDRNTKFGKLGKMGNKTILGLGDDLHRERRLGLGATAIPKANKTNSSESNEKWNAMITDKINEQKLFDGDVVMVRDGELAGRKAKVSQTDKAPGLGQIVVTMEADGKMLEIDRSQVTLVSKYCDYDAETARHKLSNEQHRNIEDGQGSVHTLNDGTNNLKKQSLDDELKYWLLEGIRVRVISKAEAHLKKGRVVEVINSKEASVQLDDSGGALKNFRQRELETVLPSVGGNCVVLCGSYRGQKALLLKKNREEETVLVTVVGFNDTISLPMDYVAAY